MSLTYFCVSLARGLISLDEECSVAAVKHRDHIDLWQLSRRPLPQGSPAGVAQQPGGVCASLGARLQLMEGVERDHIHSVSMSPAGDLVAVSGGSADGGASALASSGLRLWQLRRGVDQKGLKAVRIELPDDVLGATSGEAECQVVSFSRNGRCLALSVMKEGLIDILLLDITVGEKGDCAVVLRHRLQHSRNLRSSAGGSKSEKASLEHKLSQAVDMISFSADGRWLVVSSCGMRVSVYEVDRCVFSLLVTKSRKCCSSDISFVLVVRDQSCDALGAPAVLLGGLLRGFPPLFCGLPHRGAVQR